MIVRCIILQIDLRKEAGELDCARSWRNRIKVHVDVQERM